MKTNFFGIFIFFMLLSCQTKQKFESKVDKINYVEKIEKIPLGISKAEIIKEFGESKDMGINQAKGYYALGFSDSTVPRRYSFFFNRKDDRVFSKILDIYENEPASSIEFWKARFPLGNFKIESKTTDHGHFWTTDRWISVDKNLTLTIVKNIISQASWTNDSAPK